MRTAMQPAVQTQPAQTHQQPAQTQPAQQQQRQPEAPPAQQQQPTPPSHARRPVDTAFPPDTKNPEVFVLWHSLLSELHLGGKALSGNDFGSLEVMWNMRVMKREADLSLRPADAAGLRQIHLAYHKRQAEVYSQYPLPSAQAAGTGPGGSIGMQTSSGAGGREGAQPSSTAGGSGSPRAAAASSRVAGTRRQAKEHRVHLCMPCL